MNYSVFITSEEIREKLTLAKAVKQLKFETIMKEFSNNSKWEEKICFLRVDTCSKKDDETEEAKASPYHNLI